METERSRVAATTSDIRDGEDTELAEPLRRLQTMEEQLKAERRTTSELRESLRETKERESELVKTLAARDEAMQKHCEREEREKEASELQYYRTLDAVRVKWEAREQRVIDELDRLQRDKGGWGGVDVITLSGHLDEARGGQEALKEELNKYKGLVRELESQLEECQLVKQELKAELDLLHAKVHRLEHCGSKSFSTMDEDGRGYTGADSPSSRLDVRAPAFKPGIPVPMTSHDSVIPIPTTMVPSTITSRASGDPAVETSVPTTHGIPCTSAMTTSVTVSGTPAVVTSPASETPTHGGLHPVSSVSHSSSVSTSVPTTVSALVAAVDSAASSTSPVTPGHTEAGHPFPVTGTAGGFTTTPGGGAATSVVMSVEVPRVASFVPPVPSGFGFPYPVVPPNLPQIANFYGGDQRDGETFEEWVDQFESVARVAS